VKVCVDCGTRFDAADWRCPACGFRPAQDSSPQFAPELAHSSDQFEEALFRRLADLEEQSFWFQARNRLIAWALRKYASDARSFLDVGTGTGFVLTGLRARFPELRLVGGDLLAVGLDVARTRLPGVELLQIDARRIPYDAEFDVAGAFDVVEHIDEDQVVFSQLKQSVRPGGIVLITVPQHPWLWGPLDEFSHHRRRYTRLELSAKLRSGGLQVERITSFVSALLPGMIVSRLVARRRSTFELEREFRAARLIRLPLAAAMRAEEALIALGVSFPVGGSLLAVARRPADT
jgi:SAM-dependent methyltransferase